MTAPAPTKRSAPIHAEAGDQRRRVPPVPRRAPGVHRRLGCSPFAMRAQVA